MLKKLSTSSLCVILCLLFTSATAVAEEKELPNCNDSFISYPLKAFSPDLPLGSYPPERVHEVWQDVFFNKDDKPDRLFIVGRKNMIQGIEGPADEILVLFSADDKDREAIARRVNPLLEEGFPRQPKILGGESGALYVSLDTFPMRIPWAGADKEHPIKDTKSFTKYLNTHFPEGRSILDSESHHPTEEGSLKHSYIENIGYARATPGTYDGYPAFYMTLFTENAYDKIIGRMVVRMNEDKEFEVVCFR